MTGSGILTANVLNSGGTVSPGSSPGTLLVDGGYTQNAGGTLAIEIGGTTAGTDSDKLLVTGTATLAGTLALTTINAFSPSLSFSYVYLSAPVVTGSFSPVTGTNAGGGKTYVPSYSGIEATLTVTGPTVTRKPDGQIALGTGAFIGNNVYNMDGSGQTKSKTAGKGVTVKFTIKLQNDGSAKDQFNVQATGADKTGFTFKCMKGTVDITNAINLGAFNTNDIKAGTSVKITCSVKIGSAATHGSQVGKLLTIVSINDTSQKDAVRFVVVRS